MHLAVISFKTCWQNEEGRWVSSGGFPYQMTAICSLFDSAELLVTSCAEEQDPLAREREDSVRQPLAQDEAPGGCRRELCITETIRRSVKGGCCPHRCLAI
jgi:hypothetical protein